MGMDLLAAAQAAEEAGTEVELGVVGTAVDYPSCSAHDYSDQITVVVWQAAIAAEAYGGGDCYSAAAVAGVGALVPRVAGEVEDNIEVVVGLAGAGTVGVRPWVEQGLEECTVADTQRWVGMDYTWVAAGVAGLVPRVVVAGSVVAEHRLVEPVAVVAVANANQPVLHSRSLRTKRFVPV